MQIKLSLKRDYIFILLLFILLLFWFQDVIFYKHIFSHPDLWRYFYPLREFQTKAIKSLHIPLWNPYILCGTPFLATLQPNVFYPFSLIYYFHPSFINAFNLYIVVHFLFAGLFMYSLMKYWKFSYVARIISALVFTFGGFLTSVITMNTSMSSFIWIPLVILFFDKAMRSASISSAILCGIFLALEFLGGNPDIIYGTIWLLFFYMIGYSWINRGKGYRIFIRNFTYFFIANIIWILIDAIQILPTAELLLHSARIGGSRFKTVTRWSMTPIEILSFIIPYTRSGMSMLQRYMDPQKWLISFYVSIGALVFSVTGIFINKGRRFIFFWMVFIFSIILALGHFTPLYNILYSYVPGFKHIRYPVKFLYLGAISLSILAGMGYELIIHLRDEIKKRSISRGLLYINVIFGIALLLFFLFWKSIRSHIAKIFYPDSISEIYLFRKALYTFLNDSMYVAYFFIIFTLITILLIVFFNRLIQKKIFAFLILAVMFSDLYCTNTGLIKTSPIDFFLKIPKSIKLVNQNKGLFRVYQTKYIWEINKKVYGWNYSLGMHERKATFMCNTSMQYQISDVFGYDSLVRKEPLDFIFFVRELPPKKQYKIIGLLNGLYIISTSPEAGEVIYKGNLTIGKILLEDINYEHYYILKNPYFMERAFLADQAIVAKKREDTLGMLKNADFDPRKIVILSEDIPGSVLSLSGKVQDREIQNKEFVNIIRYRPEEVIIQARVNMPKWLVLSDSYYPGWEVFVNGKKDKIYRANYIMRAVHLKKGDHKIRFIYNSLPYRIGAPISVITILGLALYFIYQMKKKIKDG